MVLSYSIAVVPTLLDASQGPLAVLVFTRAARLPHSFRKEAERGLRAVATSRHPMVIPSGAVGVEADSSHYKIERKRHLDRARGTQ